MFVVTVSFDLQPGTLDRFLPLMRENARTSLADEPGCRQFDVCHSPDFPERIFLYEVYEDDAAFQLHLQSEHFLRFDAATAPMIATKTVHTYSEVWQ